MKESLVIGKDIKVKKGDLEISMGSLVQVENDLNVEEFAERSKQTSALVKEVSENLNTVIDRIPKIMGDIKKAEMAAAEEKVNIILEALKEAAANSGNNSEKH